MHVAENINADLTAIATQLLPAADWKLPVRPLAPEGKKWIIVFRKHKYYTHFYVELYEAEVSDTGKYKNPLVLIDPLDFIWRVDDPEVLKFLTAVARFRNSYDSDRCESDIDGLQALVNNPMQLDVYFHDPGKSPNITVRSIEPIKLKLLPMEMTLKVSRADSFYELTAKLYVNEKAYGLDLLNIKFHYFLFYDGIMHLIANADYLRLIEFFKQHSNQITLHETQFEAFQRTVLSKLEKRVKIDYSYLKPATAKQLEENNFDETRSKLIYLSDSGDYILITPVMRYGNVEVPVLSQQQIYAVDGRGNPFTVQRDGMLEAGFTSLLMRQHPYFEEQLQQECFYLHKKHFLDAGWFLDAFEQWQNQGITILGFNELKDNKLNPNKPRISIAVLSGLDWFETSVDVRFGKQQVSLKYLHKSLRNKSKFVQLGDGTFGLLPEEWMKKFAAYFQSGEIVEEVIRTPKMNFASISELYEDAQLSGEVKLELASFQARIGDFSSITAVQVPESLHGELRDYQKQGLNWLNFLDEFGFGGCLADDMGLGKTIQVIAFILLQREKGKRAANLIVVPATLIFNWQAEIARFAPSLKVHTIYGAERVKHTAAFDAYDIVLTSYGTLLYDVKHLKEYVFNCIFLDESQTLKNPTTQRYKSVALLKSRSKVMLTGTPLENNTFDLYGQLSLACPGLLGSKQFFKEQYAMPIDKFKDTRKSIELQKRVSPFILRRTKRQVATELPDKTEMVIYCEMGEEQRKVYDSYKTEYRDFLLSQKKDDKSPQSMHILKGLTILRQICDSPALLKDEVFYGNASAKLDVLMEEIESKSGQHKILVFSQFVTMLDLIREALKARNIPHRYLTGQTKDRAAEVNAFMENEDVRVFLISLKAGGTGLNLMEADYVYLVDPWWNPAVENQAIDRCYRPGQKKNVVAVRLICPDTIEEKVMKLQESKRSLVEDLIKTEGNLLKSLSRSDLLELFS
jgi:superfamily II DNA or RNA helicase